MAFPPPIPRNRSIKPICQELLEMSVSGTKFDVLEDTDIAGAEATEI
jgi:hypothetical protein